MIEPPIGLQRTANPSGDPGPYLYLCYAPDDSDEVGPIINILRENGWRVWFGPFVDGSAEAQRTERIDNAAAVVLVWSSRSAGSERVRAEAERGRARRRLLVVRLDDAFADFEGDAEIDFWRRADSAQALLDAVASVAGRASVDAARENILHRHGGKGSFAFRLSTLVVAGALLLAAGLAAGFFISRQQAIEPSGVDASNHPSASDGREAALEWETVDRHSPIAIRRFLGAFPTSLAAVQANNALARLDEEAYLALSKQKDATTWLSEAATYRLDFPSGAHIEDIRATEQKVRTMLQEAIERLSALGFLNDASREPRAAARAFQASLGLIPDGIIDQRLLGALWLSSKDQDAGEGGADRVDPAAALAPPRGVKSPATSIPPTKTVRDCFVCPELMAIPEGRFEMGSATAGASERPPHFVSIRYALAVGRHEVSFEEWDSCVADGGCGYSPSDLNWGRGVRPVMNVAPRDVEQYLSWLHNKTGKRYRLLSEAEWEYAARANSTTSWSFGNDANALCGHANVRRQRSVSECRDPFSGRSAPVGVFAPNAFGLFDMHGNVSEWVADCWHANYSGAPVDGSAWTGDCDKPVRRVARGGSYQSSPDRTTSSSREGLPELRTPTVGFRVARPLLD